MLAEAAIRFQAKTMSETDMNYELTENMVEYRPEHERLLYSLGLAGSAFKKVYYDSTMGRQVAVYIPAEDVIVPYGASHIETAERVTHVMRKTKNELKNAKQKKVGIPSPTTIVTPSMKYTPIL